MTSKTDDIINKIIKILHEKNPIRPCEIKSNSDQDFGSSAIDYAVKQGKKEKKFESHNYTIKYKLLFLPGQKHFADRRYAKETGNYNEIIQEKNIAIFKVEINNLFDKWVKLIPKGRLYFVWNCFILENHNIEYTIENDKYTPSNIHHYLDKVIADPFFNDLKSYMKKSIKFDNKIFLNPIIVQENLMKDCYDISNIRSHLKDKISCILDEMIPSKPIIEYYNEYEYGNPDELYETQIGLTHHRLSEKIICILIKKIEWMSYNSGVDWIDYFKLFKSFLEEGKQVYNYYIDFCDDISTEELINDYNFYKNHQVHRSGFNKQKFIYLKSCNKHVDEYEKIWKQLDTETEGILKKIGNSKEIEKILYEIINREKKINETLINLRKSLEKVRRILT